MLEATVKCYPEQEELLDAVVESDCFRADKLPPVLDEMRKPPSSSGTNMRLF